MIKLIVAHDMNRVIGSNGDMPWGRIAEDLKHFRTLTEENTVVMGRKTFESIGRPLPNRCNIVVSRSMEDDSTDYVVMNDIDDIIEQYNADMIRGDLCIIGGEQIYRAFLERGLVDEVYKTTILNNYKGDTFFPPIDAYGDWEKVDGKIKVIDKNLSIIFQKYVKFADK